MSRLVVCNWKMHGNTIFIQHYCQKLGQLIGDFQHCRLVIAPPAPYWSIMKSALSHLDIKLSAQSVHHMDEGAFTGDISLNMALDCGIEYLIVGHSERRTHDALIHTDMVQTAKKALERGMHVIICVGDSDIERKSCNYEQAIIQQIEEFLPHITSKYSNKLAIAYEPIWAIGTGMSANSDDINEMQHVIRRSLAQYHHQDAHVIYGGSVNEHNARDIVHNGHMDGLMIGNASLDPVKVSLIAQAITIT